MSKISNISKGEVTNIVYDAMINTNSIIAKLNPGTSNAFMYRTAAKRCNIKMSPIENVEIELGDDTTIKPTGIINADFDYRWLSSSLRNIIKDMSSPCSELPFIIFEKKWLYKDNPILDRHRNSIQVTREDGTRFKIKPLKNSFEKCLQSSLRKSP